MNSTPDHLSDEILSALLDGDPEVAVELDGADVDVAAHLRACDRCAGRQAELAGARAALAAAPIEPLDELTRRRLVAAALAEADATPAGAAPATTAIPIGRARARRHPALIGSAAAAVLALLVGVPFVLDGGGPGSNETLTAQAPLRESADSFLGDLGDLTDRDHLRLRLSGAVSDTYASPPSEAGPSPAAGAPTAAPLAGGSPGAGGLAGISDGGASTTTISPLAPVAGSRSSSRPSDGGGTAEKSSAESQAADTATANEGFAYDDQAARDRADTDRCVAALLDGPARGGRLIRSGTGTYQGRPAIVASFELSGGTVAFITDRTDCRVLDRFAV